MNGTYATAKVVIMETVLGDVAKTFAGRDKGEKDEGFFTRLVGKSEQCLIAHKCFRFRLQSPNLNPLPRQTLLGETRKRENRGKSFPHQLSIFLLPERSQIIDSDVT